MDKRLKASSLIHVAHEFFAELVLDPIRFRDWVSSIKNQRDKALAESFEKTCLKINHKMALQEILRAIGNNDKKRVRTILLRNYAFAALLMAQQGFILRMAELWYRDRGLKTDITVQEERILAALSVLGTKAKNLENRKYHKISGELGLFIVKEKQRVKQFFNEFGVDMPRRHTLLAFRLAGHDRRTERFQRAFSQRSQRLFKRLATHRNIRQALANVAIAISGIGLVAMAVKKAITGSFLFFKQTDADKKANATNMAVNQIGTQITP